MKTRLILALFGLIAIVLTHDASAQLQLTKQRTIPGQGGPVRSVAFSADGKQVAVGTGVLGLTSRRGSIRVWDLAGNKTIGLFEAPGPVEDVTFSHKGTLVTGAAHANVRVMNIEEHEIFRVMDDDATDIFRCAITPDEKKIVAIGTRSVRHFAFVWDFETFEMLKRIEGAFTLVKVSPDGRHVALGGHDNRVHIFDIETWEPLRALGEERSRRPVTAMAFSPDGKLVVAWAKRGVAAILNVETGQIAAELSPTPRQVNVAAFTPNGKHLLLGSDSLLAYDVATGKQVGELDAHGGDVTGMAFSRDGKMLVTGGLIDESIAIWSVE